MNSVYNRKKMGFTLPELLLVLLLTGMVLGLGAGCLRQTMEWQSMRMAKMELEANLANGIGWIQKDIRNSRYVSACNTDSLHLLGESLVHYSLGTDPQATEHIVPLQGNVLYRKTSGNTTKQPMVNFISDMVVSYYDRSGNSTMESSKVQAIEVELKGLCNDKEITVKACTRLSSNLYL